MGFIEMIDRGLLLTFLIDMTKILLVRLDAIGDYVLFRNFLHLVKESPSYRSAHVTLLGNAAWRDLHNGLDRETVEETIWVGRDGLFKKSLDNLLPFFWRYRPSFRKNRSHLREVLSSLRFDEILSPVVNRDPCLDELLQGIAPVIAGVRTDSSHKTDSIYTRLVDVHDRNSFIFRQNTDVMSQLLNRNIDVKPSIDVAQATPSFSDEHRPYVVLFIGASHWTKRWPLQFFSTVARHLSVNCHDHVIIAGGKEDRARAAKIIQSVNSPLVRSEAGNWNLCELACRIGRSALTVSNDTCAVHLAAATDVPFVCITNSVTGRNMFWPYPPDLARASVTLFDESLVRPPKGLIANQLTAYRALTRVSPDQVISAIYALRAKRLNAG